MGIMFLMGILLGFMGVFMIHLKVVIIKPKPNKKTEWIMGTVFALFGLMIGLGLSIDIGKKIAKKYLASQASVIVLETIGLLSFSNSNGAYIVTGENQHDKKTAWYLQEEELFEKPYNDIIDRDMIVFSNAVAPAKQLVKVNVGSFWKWFAVIPNEYRFVIPAGGLQEGVVVKNYKFIPKAYEFIRASK